MMLCAYIIQIFKRLQKLGLCVSHWKTIQIIDFLGEGFDEEVLKWKANAEENMTLPVQMDVSKTHTQ